MMAVTPSELSLLRKENFIWLGLSGVTTALSWIFYYKALKLGDVATVALIDKGSVIVAIFLAWLILKEIITLRIILGACFMLLGLIIITKK
jgi:transporter family protein